MITEKKLVNDFNSFWNALLPTMPQFVFRMNKRAIKFRNPVKLITDQDVRGLVNETAFNISVERNESLKTGSRFTVDKEVYQRAKTRAWEKIKKIEEQESGLVPINEYEVRAIYESLEAFLDKFRNKKLDIVFNPTFKGCGFLQPCAGDIQVEDTLFEVKAGSRNFRGPDIRQLLVYLSLNFFSTGYLYKNIGLVNPRTGKYVIYDVDELSYLLSGKTGLDLVNEILVFLLGYEISK